MQEKKRCIVNIPCKILENIKQRCYSLWV